MHGRMCMRLIIVTSHQSPLHLTHLLISNTEFTQVGRVALSYVGQICYAHMIAPLMLCHERLHWEFHRYAVSENARINSVMVQLLFAHSAHTAGSDASWS